MELSHNEGISFRLVFKVYDDEVLSGGHKSQIVLAFIYNKKPMVMKLARALVSPGRYPVPPQVVQPDSASRSTHSSQQSPGHKAHQPVTLLPLPSIGLPLVLPPPQFSPLSLDLGLFLGQKTGRACQGRGRARVSPSVFSCYLGSCASPPQHCFVLL